MKYAIVNGQRAEARRGSKGECPDCSAEVIPKCGEVHAHHWAHKGRRDCDPWWENETAWHRSWKDKFPAEWQEHRHVAASGEVHRADVRTENGLIIECQHSAIDPRERRSREDFYNPMVWVVDCTHLQRPKVALPRLFEPGKSWVVGYRPLVIRANAEDVAILRQWGQSRAAVHFDLGGDDLIAMFSVPGTPEVYLTRRSKADFIRWCLAFDPQKVKDDARSAQTRLVTWRRAEQAGLARSAWNAQRRRSRF